MAKLAQAAIQFESDKAASNGMPDAATVKRDIQAFIDAANNNVNLVPQNLLSAFKANVSDITKQLGTIQQNGVTASSITAITNELNSIGYALMGMFPPPSNAAPKPAAKSAPKLG